MNRRQLLALLATLPCVSGAYRGQAAEAVKKTSSVSHAFWEHHLMSAHGKPVSLAQFKGQALLVNFWASFCFPCVHELPMLDDFYLQNKKQGVRVIALSFDKNLSQMQRFVRKVPLSLNYLWAGPSASLEQWASQLGATTKKGILPQSFLISEKEQLLQHKIGALQEDELTQWQKIIAN